MKLLKKYRTYTYTSLVFAIILGFIANYHLYKQIHFRTTDKVIKEYQTNIEDYAEEHKTLEPLMAVNSKFGQIKRIDSASQMEMMNVSIKDTLAYDAYQEENIIFRKLVFPVQTQDGSYIVRLMLPTLGRNYLVGTSLLSLFIFVTIFVIFTSLIDQLFTRKIFIPFRIILQRINAFNIENRKQLKLDQSDIDEFQDLSRNLNQMVNKINNGYFEMKEFLEYTSHELQTPLSVIQLKLETLNQKNFEDEEALKAISSIQTSLQKVIRFNRSILFIAKIRNGQYAEGENINLRLLIKNFIKQYEELIAMKGLSVTIKDEEDCMINIHPILADHLIQNILTNAIKHNFSGGKIEIYSYKDKIEVLNTFNGTIPEGDLFEKYNHSKEQRESSGLGLAMVKTICLKNNMEASYRTKNDQFIITLLIKRRSTLKSDNNDTPTV